MDNGSEPIHPDEIIYRRVSPVFFQPGDPFPSPQAFTPTRNDIDGLSVYRAKYTASIEEIAYNDRGVCFYVAVLTARELIDAGIAIVPSPDHAAQKPGHAHLPAINYRDRKLDDIINKIITLATRLSEIRGPFPSMPPSQTT